MNIYLVCAVTFDYEEAKTVIAARSTPDAAIELARQQPPIEGGTWLACYYYQVTVVELDGKVNPQGAAVIWQSEERNGDVVPSPRSEQDGDG